MSATIDGRPRLSGMARRVEPTPTTVAVIDAGNLPGPIRTDPSLTTLAVVTNTHDPRQPYGRPS